MAVRFMSYPGMITPSLGVTSHLLSWFELWMVDYASVELLSFHHSFIIYVFHKCTQKVALT